MKRIVFIVLFFIGGQIALPAQVPAVWNYVDRGIYLPGCGLTLNDSDNRLITWGTRYDSCSGHITTLLVLDTAGTLILDTTYEFTYCLKESPLRFVPNADGPGYYMITSNDNNTPSDSLFVHFIDSSFTFQWQQYLGRRNIRSQIVRHCGRNYISTDDGTLLNRNVLRFYQPGIVDTFTEVTHPYFNEAPEYIFASNGSIYEIGSKNDLDSSFLCMVYDTLGNLQSSFSFDANVNTGETSQYMVTHNNRIFHVSAGGNIYPASYDLSGTVNWTDTLSYQLMPLGVSLDTVNDVAYIFCTSASGKRLFSYDFNTGARIDSIIVDSVFTSTPQIKSGPAGGVFLYYRQQYTLALLLEQYDAHFNLIWRGYVSHPTCTAGSYPYDFIFDPLGNVYALSHHSCSGVQTLISKFTPSLVSVPESNPEQHVSLFPNPANSEVRVQLNVQSGNSRVNILNSLGEIVLRKSFTGNSATLDITGLPSGLYLVEIISGSEQHSTQKLIIQHP
jgi:hypothetical protein